MNNRVPITIRIDQFEGPLDLLLYLIHSHELDISRVAISEITDQYLVFVKLMQELNFDVASEFLVMAATLIYWKSKALLPADPNAQAAGDDEEPAMTEEELLRRLREHQLYLAAGEHLAGMPLLGDSVFVRANPKPPIEKIWKEMNVTQLATTYQDILVRARKRSRILKKETVSLTDKIVEFAARLEIGKMTDLDSLISAIRTRPEIVVSFLASLELARLKKLKIYQEGTYQKIYVELIEAIRELDITLAKGFDQIEQRVEEQVQESHA